MLHAYIGADTNSIRFPWQFLSLVPSSIPLLGANCCNHCLITVVQAIDGTNNDYTAIGMAGCMVHFWRLSISLNHDFHNTRSSKILTWELCRLLENGWYYTIISNVCTLWSVSLTVSRIIYIY